MNTRSHSLHQDHDMNTEINPSSTTGARHVMKQHHLIPSSLRHCKRNTLAAACLMAMSGMAGAQVVALSITYGGISPSGTNTTAASSLSGFSRQPGAFQYTTSDALNTPATLYIGSSLTGTSATPTSLTNQLIQALTSGNVLSPDPSVGKTFDLSLLNNGSTSSAVAYALQYSSGLVTAGTPGVYNSQTLTSSTSNALIELRQSGMTSSVRALNTNTIKSNLELNNAQLLASGVVSGTYSSSNVGLASGSFSATGAAIGTPGTSTTGAKGSVVLSTVQGAFNANATSTVSNGDVVMALQNTSSTSATTPKVGTLTDALSVTNNAVTANVQANIANSVYQATSTSGAWTGSVAVATVQSGVETGNSAYTASNEKSTITADVRDATTPTTNYTTLGTGLTLSNNTLSSTSAINTSGTRSATTGLISTAGNAIQFDSPSSVTGASTTTSSSVTASTASAAADLAVMNLQSVNGTSVLVSVDPSSLGTALTTSGVTLSADQLVAGGSTSQNNNRIVATGVNNQGGNLISVGQTSTSTAMTASTAVVNDQNAVGSSVVSTVKNAEVATRIGFTGKTNTGTATVDSNTISATSDGNVSGSTTALAASTLTVSGNLLGAGTQGITLNTKSGTGSSAVGVSSMNVQLNSGLELTANNNATRILLLSANPDDVTTAAPVSAFQGVLTNNTLSALASGNTAVSTVSTTATTATGLSAAVGNSQSNALTGVADAITAAAGLTNSLNIKLMTGAATNSQLTLSNDSILATARSNRASNSLTTNVSASGTGAAALFTSTDPTFTAGDPNLSANPTSALADLTIANAQVHNGKEVNATATGTIDLVTGALSGAAGTPMTVTSSNNTIKAATLINEAGNTATLNVGQMSALSGGIASAQTINTLSTSANTQSTAITLNTGTSTPAAVVGTQINMQGNTLAATTNGNLAANALSTSSSLSTTRGLTSNATTTASSPDLVVVSDLGVASNQMVQAATLSSLMDTTGTVANEGIRLVVGAVSAASQITQSGNTIQATAEMNTVNNSTVIAGGNMNGTTSGLANRQIINNSGAGATSAGSVTSTVRDTVAMTTGAVSGASVLTMNGNVITATGLGNYATNAVSATGTTLSNASGATGLVSAMNSTTGIQRVTSDHALLNVQSDADTAYNVTTTATQVMTTAALSGNSTLAFTGNQATSAVQINYAANSQSWLLGTSFDRAQVGLASSQLVTGAGSDDANAITTSTQKVTTASATLASTNVDMTGNLATSSAVSNVVNNSITVAGTSPTTKPVITGAGLTSANKAILTGTAEVSVTADVGLANYQSSTGKSPTATTTADMTMVVGAVSKTGSTPALTMSDNTVSATAETNAASNRVSIAASTMTAMTAGVANGQYAASDVTALAQPTTGLSAFSLTAGTVSSATLTMTGNTLAASATVNRATNALEVSATNLGGQGGAASLYNDTAAAVGSNQVGTVDFSVLNNQYAVNSSAGGSVTATAIPLLMRANATSLSSSSLTMSDNTLQALASGNMASNTLALNATSNLTATGAVKNVQSVDTDLIATLGSGSRSVFGTNIPTLSNANINMSNNTFQAQAGGNNANNVLNALAGSSVAPSASATSPTYAVLNRQDTSAASSFTAAVSNLDIGVPTGAGATTSWSNSNVTLQGNRVVALAYGNMASNVVTMNALAQGQDTATASITNTQNSRGALASSVTGVNIMASATGVTTGSVNMGGNSITSQIVANQVYNSVTSR